MSTKTINFGDECRCIITGFEGVVTAKFFALHSSNRVTLQPPVNKEGKIPDPYDFDTTQVKVIKAGKVKPPEVDVVEHDIVLGDEVQDPVTGHKGIAVGRMDFMNGCIKIGVQAVVDKDKKVPDSEWFPAQRLKITKSQKHKLVDKTERTPGGPITKSMRF